MTRLLSTVHGWLGFATCLLFTLWFASGLVMIFTSFPGLKVAQTRMMAPPVDMARVAIAPSEIVHRDIKGLTLRSDWSGAPVYIVRTQAGLSAIDAQTGLVRQPLSKDQAAAHAAAYGEDGLAAIQGVTGPFEVDQWTVHQAFDPYRPFYRVRLSGRGDTDLHISAVTGDIVQVTTGRERAWNRAGAVVHWIYVTAIRKDWGLWDGLVWWVSLVCIVTAMAGYGLGAVRLVTARRSPFKGWMRWHHVLGLTIGVVTLTWIYSGWLSMDHGRIFSTPEPTAEQRARYQGISLTRAIADIKLEAVTSLTAQQIAFTAVGGRPHMVVTHKTPRPKRLTLDHIAAAVEAAWPDAQVISAAPVAKDDPYTALVEGSLPPEAVRITLDDARQTWVHVNAHTGEIISVMDASRRRYRWHYNALHSFDVPWLSARPALRKGLLFLFCMAGLVFAVTGVVLSVRKLRRLSKHTLGEGIAD